MGAVLTPAIWHDFQGQGHQIIKRGIQDHGTNVWIGHGCPCGWYQDREEGRGQRRCYPPLQPCPTDPIHVTRLAPGLSLTPHVTRLDYTVWKKTEYGSALKTIHKENIHFSDLSSPGSWSTFNNEHECGRKCEVYMYRIPSSIPLRETSLSLSLRPTPKPPVHFPLLLGRVT